MPELNLLCEFLLYVSKAFFYKMEMGAEILDIGKSTVWGINGHKFIVYKLPNIFIRKNFFYTLKKSKHNLLQDKSNHTKHYGTPSHVRSRRLTYIGLSKNHIKTCQFSLLAKSPSYKKLKSHKKLEFLPD
jgi:hypothetical protein